MDIEQKKELAVIFVEGLAGSLYQCNGNHSDKSVDAVSAEPYWVATDKVLGAHAESITEYPDGCLDIVVRAVLAGRRQDGSKPPYKWETRYKYIVSLVGNNIENCQRMN